MNNTYTLVEVTDLQGNKKENVVTQSNAVGQKCTIANITFGGKVALKFDGFSTPAIIRTSTMQKIEVLKDRTGIAITTLNSIYFLEREV